MKNRYGGRHHRRAYSLIETIIAFGVLVGAFAVFFSLYYAALSYSGKTDREVIAATVAQRQLTKLRGWASEPVGTNRGFDDWSQFTDVSFTDEDYPDFQVRIQSAFETVTSPTSSLIDGPDPRVMSGTFRKVQVTVSWTDDSLTMMSLIGDPSRRLRAAQPIEMLGSGGTVARDAEVAFSLKVFDTDGREIPDVMARWYVKAITGAGSITSNAVGSTATFKNVSEKFDGTPQYTGGECRVTARVVYGGQEAWAESDLLVLDP